MTGSALVESCLVDLVVKSLDESVTVALLNVKTVKEMPSTSCIVKTEDLTWWPHLRDIDIPVLENGGVLLLIGLKENPGLFLPLECKSGGHDEPIAIRYSLQWVQWRVSKGITVVSEFCPHKGKSVDAKGSPLQH